MKSLPIGYRIVGGLVIAYAVFTGWVTAILFDSFSPGSPGKSIEVDGLLLACAYAYQSVALLLAGCLLFARQAKRLRAAQLALIAAALGCLLQGILLIIATYWAFTSAFTSHQSQGPLAIFIIIYTGPMFLIAALWMVITSITAVMLGRHLKRAQRFVNYKERFASLPTEALTTTLESGALDAAARDAVDQILRDRLQPPGQIDTRFQGEKSASPDRPRD